jgi:hypothetical protein
MRCLQAGLTLFSPPPSRPPSTSRSSSTRTFNFKFLILLVYLEKLYIMVRVCRTLSIAPPNACSFFSCQSYGNGNSNGYGGYHSNNYGGGGYGGGWGGDRNGDSLGGGLRNIDWSQQKSIPFEKNFYVEDKRVSSRSDREIEEFRRLKEIKVRSSQSCPAMLN